jgi:endonuclease III
MDGVSRVKRLVAALEHLYGSLKMPVTEPFAMILLEGASYLVDDARRLEVLYRLRDVIGLDPAKIGRQSPDKIAHVIAAGGMKPEMRAQKVLDSARIAIEVDLGNALTKKTLMRFPSVGEPYADKILLFNGLTKSFAPDSNALRVVTRLGFVEEKKSYSAWYRTAVAALPFTRAADAQRAHLLFRRHGQETCKRAAPRCEVCPLREDCAWYLAITR